MRQLTLVMAYYENGTMLERHLQAWSEYSPEAREGFSVVIVDDGSPKDPALPRLRDFPGKLPPIELFRVGVNIPWNQNGARNLAMKEGRGGWCLLTDMDHLLTERALVNLKDVVHRKAGRYYVPEREKVIREEPWWAKPYHRHPNSFMLHQDDYWRAGGYDEDFCGWYGSDRSFRRMLDTVCKRMELEGVSLLLYGREVVADASTTEFGRKDSRFHSSNNPQLAAKKKATPAPAKNPIRFPWERLYWNR